jgi:hypothetical protein
MHERFGHAWPKYQYAGDTKNWNNTFIPVALLCYSEQWDPEDYVKVVLGRVFNNHVYVKPAVLRHQNGQNFYTEMVRKGAVGFDPQVEWDYQINMLLTIIEETGAYESRILLSPMMPFPAWFRLVYPEKLDSDIFAIYGEDGRKDFTSSKTLRAFVRKVTPNTFSRLEERWGCFGDVEEQIQ